MGRQNEKLSYWQCLEENKENKCNHQVGGCSLCLAFNWCLNLMGLVWFALSSVLTLQPYMVQSMVLNFITPYYWRDQPNWAWTGVYSWPICRVSLLFTTATKAPGRIRTRDLLLRNPLCRATIHARPGNHPAPRQEKGDEKVENSLNKED